MRYLTRIEDPHRRVAESANRDMCVYNYQGNHNDTPHPSPAVS